MSNELIDVNELIQMSTMAREEKEKSRNEKYEDAYKAAIDVIIENSLEKMKLSASRGFEKSIIYQFKYNPDPESETDENGIKIKFNGIWLLDMLIKGNRRFLQLLGEHFNKGLDEPKFYCYFQKRESDNIYRIFVSWYKRPAQDSTDEKSTVKTKATLRKKQVTTRKVKEPNSSLSEESVVIA
jgi:hypothetical protein